MGFGPCELPVETKPYFRYESTYFWLKAALFFPFFSSAGVSALLLSLGLFVPHPLRKLSSNVCFALMLILAEPESVEPMFSEIVPL